MENIAFIQLNERKVKLVIIQSKNGRYRILEEVENYYDLTHDITKDCLFSPKSKTDLLKILSIYRYTIATFNVEKMVAIASNIIVKARNYRGFLDEIYTNTGMNFTIMTPDETAKNIYQSCMTHVDVSKGYIVFINSFDTYILKFNRRNVVEYNTIPYGYTNLTEMGLSLDEMISTVKKELKKCSLVKAFEEDVVVACGPAMINISRVAKKLTRYPIDIDNNYELSNEDLNKVLAFVRDLDAQKVKKIKGLSQEGPESIYGGLAIACALSESLKNSNMVVSTAEEIKGVVLSNLVGTANEKYTDLLQNSLDNYYEFKKEGLAINSHVYEMAILLFKHPEEIETEEDDDSACDNIHGGAVAA